MKQALRREMRRILFQTSEGARRAASEAAQERLMKRPEFRNAQRVALYCNRPEEAATDRLCAVCWAEGRAVAVPAWRAESREYAFSLWSPGIPMAMGPLGILQPAQSVWVSGDEMDLIVVPGLAFDRRGGRLGRGKGFYDRLLAGAGGACKAGLCFRWQICDWIPMAPHDVWMDLVVADDAVYCGSREAREQCETLREKREE